MHECILLHDYRHFRDYPRLDDSAMEIATPKDACDDGERGGVRASALPQLWRASIPGWVSHGAVLTPGIRRLMLSRYHRPRRRELAPR